MPKWAAEWWPEDSASPGVKDGSLLPAGGSQADEMESIWWLVGMDARMVLWWGRARNRYLVRGLTTLKLEFSPPPPALRPHRCIGVWLPGTGGMCFCHEAQAHGREHGEDADNGTCDTSRYNMYERCLPNRLPFRNLFGPDFFIPMNNQEWTVLSI